MKTKVSTPNLLLTNSEQMKRKHVENGQQQTCLAIRNGLLSFFLLHTKALSANNQYVPL